MVYSHSSRNSSHGNCHRLGYHDLGVSSMFNCGGPAVLSAFCGTQLRFVDFFGYSMASYGEVHHFPQGEIDANG